MASIITMKGIGEGIKLILSPEVPFSDILSELYNIVRSHRRFFDGDADIYITGRELNSSDKLRLESVMKSLFPSHKVIYGEPVHKKRLSPKVMEAYEMMHQDLQENIASQQHISKENALLAASQSSLKIKTVLKNVLPSSKALNTVTGENDNHDGETQWNYLSVNAQIQTEFFKGEIKKGEIVRVDGNLLIEGSVLAGGVAQASGNIIIIGSLQGIAWAGAAGNEDAYILALDFMPMQIRIADYTKDMPCIDTSTRYKIKKAYLKDNVICVERYRINEA